MNNSLKKLDKKFLVIAGIIMFVPILIVIVLAIIQSCSNRVLTYEKYEGKMISAAEKYFKNTDSLPQKEGEKVTVQLKKLIKDTYIPSTEKLMKDDTCTGSVTARRNASSKELEKEGVINYTVTLNCDSYSTVHLIDLLKESVVTEGSGLYKVGDEYIFKGESPRNYIKLYDNDYRIMGIDSNGLVKVISAYKKTGSSIWDKKYNSSVKKYYGINIYKESTILKNLNEIYNNNKKFNELRDKIVSHSVCLDSRDINDVSLTQTCSNTLENQPVSLISVVDYARASLDSGCDNILSRSCGNYNYLRQFGLSTWTINTVSNNSYEVYYLDSGYIQHKEASDVNSYNLVFYIDGDEIVTGKGMEKDPYVIE